MINTLLGIKKGMTSSYDTRGRRVGATLVQVASNLVTQIKSKDKDGYQVVQIGIGSKKSVKKPQIGHLKKAGIEQKLKFIKESRIKENSGVSLDNIQQGTSINLNQIFSRGDAVKVTGISKGRGFQGVVKRHGFHGGPKTHGQSDRHRAPGSIGQTTTPGRVYKGKKMAGHMGVSQISVKGLEVIKVDKTNQLLVVKGAIPGPVGALVMIQKMGRIKGYTPPPEEKIDEEEEVKTAENRDVPQDQVIEAAATLEPQESNHQEQKTPAGQVAKEASENTEGEDQNA